MKKKHKIKNENSLKEISKRFIKFIFNIKEEKIKLNYISKALNINIYLSEYNNNIDEIIDKNKNNENTINLIDKET